MRSQIEHVLLHLRRGRKRLENSWIDDDMAGGAGHLALAGALQRLPGGLRDIKQTLARRRLHLGRQLAARIEETDQRHATTRRCASAAWRIRVMARSISSLVVYRPKPRRMLERASPSPRPIAFRTWLGRPEPLAQAEPAEKAISGSSDISRATSSPARRTLRLPCQRRSAEPLSTQPSPSVSRACRQSASTWAASASIRSKASWAATPKPEHSA